MTDSASTPRIIGLTTLYEGWSQLLAARIRLANGMEMAREVEDHGEVVALLPYDPEARVTWLVGQLRVPMLHAAGLTQSLEAPAGIIEGDDPQDCARREAMEEAGLRLGALEPAGLVWSTPGVSTERIHLFLAPCRVADRVAEGGGLDDEHEFITVHEISLPEVVAMVDDGRVSDMKTALLVRTLQLRRPELFAA
jgi:nudix-type nucleoside diphosphatase (YffH/AdpP family)